MKIVRTANAGVWIELDGMSLLLDGVANQVYPYIATPMTMKEALEASLPDVLAFTHTHQDHYDAEYARFYEETMHRPVVGPVGVNHLQVGRLKIEAVSTRHIGKAEVAHFSFAISGEKQIWFMGDASPVMLREMAAFPKPDVLFVPYAYALTASAWRKTKETGAGKIVLLHLPKRQDDAEGLWDAVMKIAGQDACLCIPEIGQEIEVN